VREPLATLAMALTGHHLTCRSIYAFEGGCELSDCRLTAGVRRLVLH
jgi:hypothetical protein